jgi:NADH:ubiquinone oxidoreductase subunit
MSAPKQRIKNVLENAFLKSEVYRQSFMKQKQDANDRAENREYLGSDKFGNQYFQYFSYHGLPTRRRVYYKFFSTNKFHIDIHFIDWLYHRTAIPPSKTELHQLYIEDENRHKLAFEWDKQEEQKQIAHKRELKKLGIDPEQYLLESNEDLTSEDTHMANFKPLQWEMIAKTRTDLKRYLPPEEYKQDLISMEEGIKEEHDNYQDYLRSKGKDIDIIAALRMRNEISKIRHHYVEIQRYGYMKDDLDDQTTKIKAGEAREKLPEYADHYLERHKVRIKKDLAKEQAKIDDARLNEKKHRRYYDFKQEFNDIFEEHKQISKGNEPTEIVSMEMEMIEGS